MLAGAIEFNSGLHLGNQLLALASAPEGLAHIPFDNSDGWSNGKVTLVQQLFWNTPESKQVEGIACHEPSGVRVVAWARIDNRNDLLARLPDHLQPLARTDPGLILAGYLHWQDKVCENLVGDFCFAIHDPRSDSLYCGRDHLGVRPFYYYWDGRNFVFASSIAILAGLQGIDLGLSEEWLARYLLYVSRDWELTAYQEIKKLPPAHFLAVREGRIQCRKYFDFSEILPLTMNSHAECVEVYRHQLAEAVQCHIRSDYPVGSESSGGLDSATVTALASHHMVSPRADLHSFGYATDEYSPGRIMSVSQSVPMCMTHLITSTGLYADDPKLLRETFFETSGVPEEQAIATYHDPFYRTASGIGARTMLSGYGGDEFVTTDGQLALLELWRNRQYGKFVSRQSGIRAFSALKWVVENVRQDRQSATSRAVAKNFRNRLRLSLVNDEAIARYGISSLLEKEAVYDSGRRSLNEFTLEARLDPWISARLENCTLMATGRRVEYRWPLLDVRLISLFLSIPAEFKYGPGGQTRYLHRCAVKDLIPEVIARGSKYTGQFVGPRHYKATEEGAEALAPHPLIQPLLNQANFEIFLRECLLMDINDPVSLAQFENYEQFNNLNHWLHYIEGIRPG